MRVLVTGGAGYIGSHTAKVLTAAGHETIAFDNLSEGRRDAVRWGPLIEADLAETDHLREVIQRHRIEAVVHFAANAYVGESVVEPKKYFRNNVSNTLHLLEVMHDCGIRHIVFSSTCATYGMPETLPMTEDHPQQPVNPYGESKLFVERALHWYGRAYDLQWISLRYFNAAGADPDCEIGEDHDPETHLLPLAIRAALGQGPALEIYGQDYDTFDGTPIRDYIHVMDLARAHVLALEHLVNGGESMALNLGTGEGHSVLEVVRTVEEVLGRKVPVRWAERRAGDPDVLVADASLARGVLGWTPEYPDLRSMVGSAARWEARRLEPALQPAGVLREA